MMNRGSALRFHIRDVDGYSYGILLAQSDALAREYIAKVLGPRPDYSFEWCGCIMIELPKGAQWADDLIPDLIEEHVPRRINVHVEEVIWSRKPIKARK
jgi:hypothetical protein